MSGIKRKRGSESDTDDNGTSADIREDDDSMPASRSAGRVRKKSAKVLEMEEFEEAEKKQYKKTDSSKKQVQPGIPPAKKLKIKSEEAEASEAVSETVVPPSEPEPEEPVISTPVISTPVTPPPKKTAKSSVIKLLLSSPAVPTTPAVSTKNVTKSKQAEVKKEPESQGVTASTKKAIKSKVKIKDMTSPTKTVPTETPLQIDTVVDVKPAISLTPESLTTLTPHSTIYTMPEIASISPAAVQDGSLKMKLILSPKQESADPEFSIPEPTSVVKSAKKVKKKKEQQLTETTAVPSTASSKSPSEAMPNLAALVNAAASTEIGKKKKLSKQKKSKKELDFEFETLKDTFDPNEVDEEPQLVIADPSQEADKKKKNGNKLKKKLKLEDNGESTVTPEGDIATLSAKVAKQGFKKKRKEYHLKKPKIKKNKRPPTAYTLWCNAHRHEVLKENPKMDFSQMSRRLGVIWQGLSKKEKMAWKRKAKKLAGKGSTLISTGKIKPSTSTQPAQIQQPPLHVTTTTSSQSSTALRSPNSLSADRNRKQAVDDTIAIAFQRGLGTDPVDVAAHLKLMGESLCNIGMRLQETKGHMAVQGGLSVLLDSLICACGPLMCLTQQMYELNGCDRNTHAKTLDNIAYIMPGL